jgi:ubiquinone/menaquinone biosynthesis C-methylase UbiE
MTQSVQKFYDDLSQDYDLIFTDWHASVLLQGETLHNIIKAQIGKESAYILDCSCGIGTQSIGLAKQVICCMELT